MSQYPTALLHNKFDVLSAYYRVFDFPTEKKTMQEQILHI